MSYRFNPVTQTPFLGVHDSNFFEATEAYLAKHAFTPSEALEYWMILTRRTTLQRFLALSELVKLTLDIPGDIAEFGVWQGHSLLTWANLLEIYCNNDRSKRVFGFDTFSGFPGFHELDGSEDTIQRKTTDAFKHERSYARLVDAIALYDSDRFVPWKERICLVKGDVMSTLPAWLEKNAGRRFSLIYLDLDIYEPTKLVIESLWEKIPRGGVIAFDEYAKPTWQGESLAVDEFFHERGEVIRKLPWNSSPGGYIQKGVKSL